VQVNSQFGEFKGSQLWNKLTNDLIDIFSSESYKQRFMRNFLTGDPLWSCEIVQWLFSLYIMPYFIALYHILSRGVALYCTCTTCVVCTLSIFRYCFHWVICLPRRPVSEFYASLAASGMYCIDMVVIVCIHVTDVQIKTKITLKTLKKRGKFLKKLQTFDKNVADICHESNYYLCTLSHM